MRLPRSRPRRPGATTIAAVAVVLALCGAGCQLSDPAQEVADAPSEAALPGATATSLPTPPAPGPQPCPNEDATAIDEVVGNQLAAFAAGDFAAALEWTTPGFRQSFPLARFEAMITTEFPIPATASDHSMQDCQVIASVARAIIVVSGEGGTQTLQYGLQRLPEGWRIDGAIPVDVEEAEIV